MHSPLKKLLIVAVFISLGGISSRAEADQVYGYVCEVYANPQKHAQYGDHGFLHFVVYTKRGCEGNKQGAFIIYTTGCTNSWSDPAFYYSEARILNEAAMLQRAMLHDHRIMVPFSSAYPVQARYIKYLDLQN